MTSSYTALIETIPDTVSGYEHTWIFLMFLFLVLYLIHNISPVLSYWIFVLQASIHSIKGRFPNVSSLRDYYIAKYEENSQNFKLAQVSAM